MLERGIALGAKGRKIRRNLAKARLQERDWEGVVLAWQGAREQSLTHAATWEDLGDTLAELGRQEEARAAYQNAKTYAKSESARRRTQMRLGSSAEPSP